MTGRGRAGQENGMAAVQQSDTAGVDVITDIAVPERDHDDSATSLRQFCRAQPELAGFIIGVALSAPLVVILLNM